MMTEARQRVPVEGATRLLLDSRDADVLARWVADIDEIILIGREIPVERAGSEIIIWADAAVQPDNDDGDQVKISGLGLPGGIGPEEILIRTGLFSGRRKRQNQVPIQILVPYQISATTFDLKGGDLHLDNPQGTIECRLKRGDFASSGGAAEVSVSTGSGDVWFSGLSGSIRSAGGSGDVTIMDAGAEVNVAAGSGDISLLRVDSGDIKIAAGSGEIEIQNTRAQSLAIESGSGDISLRGGRLEQITARTGSGDIDCSVPFGAHAQTVNTASGNIALGVPGGLPARIEAFTSRGDIESDLPLVSVGQRGPRSRKARRQVGSVGSGEPRAEVSVRTSSGDIRLYWLEQAGSDFPGAEAEAAPSQPPEASQPADVPIYADPPGSDDEPESSPGDAQRAVLESLARGEISADEADVLLQRLEGEACHPE